MKKIYLILFVLALTLATAGCVRRIVTIDSQPQGAQVYFDRKLIGETPCMHTFQYYGGHHLELVKDGFANLKTVLRLKGPIYEHFPFAFFAELVIPWKITDRHSVTFPLKKGQRKEALISPIQQPQPALSEPRLERREGTE